MTVVNIQQQTQAAFTPRGNVPSPVTPHGWERDPQLSTVPPIPARVAVTAALIAGFSVVGLAPPPIPPPQGASRFVDRAVQKPVPAAQQQWSAFQPQGFVPPPPPPMGARNFFQSVVRKPTLSGISTASVGFATSFTPIGVAFFDSAVRKPFSPALQRPADFVPAGTIVSVLPPVIYAYFDRAFQKPVNSALQRPADFAPAGDIVSVVTEYWGWAQAQDVLARLPRLRVVADGLVGPVVSSPQGWARFFDAATIKPFKTPLQRFDHFQPQGEVTSTTPQGWERFFDRAVQKPLSSIYQQWASFQPLYVASYTPQGWGRFFDYAVTRRIDLPELLSVPLYPLVVVPFEGVVKSSFSIVAYATEIDQGPGLPPSVESAAEVVTAESFFDRAALKPLAAAQQQWSAFQLQGQVTSTTPQGWERFFDHVAQRPPAPQQQEGPFNPQAPFAAPQGASRFFDHVVQKPLAQRQYETFQAFVQVTSRAWVVTVEPVQPHKVQPELSALVVPPTQEQAAQDFKSFFSSIVSLPTVSALISYPTLEPAVAAAAPQGSYFFDRAVQQPLSPAQQRYAYFTPTGTIVSFTPHGWERFAFQSIVRQPPLAISYSAGTPAIAALTFQAWGFSDEPARARRPLVDPIDVWRVSAEVRFWGWSQAQDAAAIKPVVFEQPVFQPQGTITSVTPQGWERFFDSALTKPLSVSQQRDGAFAPQAPFVAPQGAPYFFDIANIAPLAAKLQQWEAFQPRGQIAFVTPQGWERFFDVVWTAPVKPSLQSFAHWQPLGQVPTAATPQGWERFFDRTVQKPLSAIYQQWAAFAPAGTIAVEPIRPAPIQFDINTIKPLAVTLQRFDHFQPQGEVTSTTPQGWERFFDRTVQRPLNPAQQRYEGFQPRGQIVIATPQGWSNFFDATRIPPYPAPQQQWAAYPVRSVVSLTPQGWSVFFDRAAQYPLAAALQRYDAFQTLGQIVYETPQGWERFFDRVVATPTPAKLQTFAYWQPHDTAVFSWWSAFFDHSISKLVLSQPEFYALREPFFTPQGWQGELFNMVRVQRPLLEQVPLALEPFVAPEVIYGPVKASFGVVVQVSEIDQAPGLPPTALDVGPQAAAAGWESTFDQAPAQRFKVAEQPALFRFIVAPVNFGFAQVEAPVVPRIIRPAELPLLQRFAAPVTNFGFAQIESQALRRIIRPEEVPGLITAFAAEVPEAVAYGWSSDLSVGLVRQFGPPPELTSGLFRFVRFRGLLVCAGIELTVEVGGSLILRPELDGSLSMTPELAAALALDPAVAAGLQLTPELAAALGIDPELIALLELQKC